MSIQSVLATAGAGLLAVAAIVFTFLNPDLASFAVRTVIVGVISAAFLAGAWLMASKALRMSAETVGALGVLLLALDIWALSTAAPLGSGGFATAALATLGCSVAMIVLGTVTGIRVWLWAGLVGLTLVPAFTGYALGTPWTALLGHLAAGFVAVGLHPLIRRQSRTLGNALRADHVTATTIQVISLVVVLLQLAGLFLSGEAPALAVSAVFVALAVLSVLGAQTGATAFWSWIGGALVACAFVAFALAFWSDRLEPVWLFALVPTATMLAVVATAVTPAIGRLRTGLFAGGAWAVSLVGVVPAGLLGLVDIVEPRPSSTAGLVAALALVCTAAGSCALSLLTRSPGLRASRVVGLWFAAAALLSITAQSAFLPATRSVIGVVIALALVAVTVKVPAVARWTPRLRAPLIAGAHVILLYAAAAAWVAPGTRVFVGIAVVGTIAALSLTMPTVLRPVYVGLGYLYALVVFAAALQLAHIDVIAILCLTTSLGSLGAIGATFAKRLSVHVWYAVARRHDGPVPRRRRVGAPRAQRVDRPLDRTHLRSRAHHRGDHQARSHPRTPRVRRGHAHPFAVGGRHLPRGRMAHRERLADNAAAHRADRRLHPAEHEPDPRRPFAPASPAPTPTRFGCRSNSPPSSPRHSPCCSRYCGWRPGRRPRFSSSSSSARALPSVR